MNAGASAGKDTGKDQAKAELHGSAILAAIKDSGVQFILSVPDIVTSAGLLRPISRDPDLRLVRVCKEDECIGIASGLSYCDKRALILIQYTGFLDSLNAFATSARLDQCRSQHIFQVQVRRVSRLSRCEQLDRRVELAHSKIGISQ